MAAADTIKQLETDFWQSMKDKDAKRAAAMIADEALVIGPSGPMRIDPAKYEAMTNDGVWTLESFEMSDVDVVFPTEDTAVIAYKVHQTGTMKDQKMDLKCADSSTWVRDGSDWKCVLHTETIAGHMPLTN